MSLISKMGLYMLLIIGSLKVIIIYLLKAAIDFLKRNSKKSWGKGFMCRGKHEEYTENEVQGIFGNVLIDKIIQAL